MFFFVFHLMNVQFRLLVVENAVIHFWFDFLIKDLLSFKLSSFFLQPILHFGDAYLSCMNHDLKIRLKIPGFQILVFSLSWLKN